MTEAVIVGAVRTPMGRHHGNLKDVRPDDLAALVVGEVVRRAGLDPAIVEEVYLGCANQAGEDNRNVARMAALLAGFPGSVAAVTFNRLCSSGLSAINAAARAIKAGEGDVFVAGGVESMSRAPYAIPKSLDGRLGNVTAWETPAGLPGRREGDGGEFEGHRGRGRGGPDDERPQGPRTRPTSARANRVLRRGRRRAADDGPRSRPRDAQGPPPGWPRRRGPRADRAERSICDPGDCRHARARLFRGHHERERRSDRPRSPARMLRCPDCLHPGPRDGATRAARTAAVLRPRDALRRRGAGRGDDRRMGRRVTRATRNRVGSSFGPATRTSGRSTRGIPSGTRALHSSNRSRLPGPARGIDAGDGRTTRGLSG